MPAEPEGWGSASTSFPSSPGESSVHPGLRRLLWQMEILSACTQLHLNDHFSCLQPHRVVIRIKWINACEVFTAVPGTWSRRVINSSPPSPSSSSSPSSSPWSSSSPSRKTSLDDSTQITFNCKTVKCGPRHFQMSVSFLKANNNKQKQKTNPHFVWN